MAKREPIGLIAGAGSLPLHFARQAKDQKLPLFTAAIGGAAPLALNSLSEKIQWLSIGQLGVLLDFFRKNGVRRTVLHGKVRHASLFRGLGLDLRALKLWASLKDRSGEGLLKGLAAELGKSGVRVLDARYLMKDLLVPKGCLTRNKPSKEEMGTVLYGLKLARASAKLGIGQTVLVKKKAVVAVEAMEGTDQAILRAGKVAGPGCILVKAASPRQDWRFDIPVVGPDTFKNLARIRARGLVLESGRCFWLGQEGLLREADRERLFLQVL